MARCVQAGGNSKKEVWVRLHHQKLKDLNTKIIPGICA